MKNQEYFSNYSTRETGIESFSLVRKKLLTLNAIAPFHTKFPIQLPLSRLRKASMNDWVLDPYCGRDTTLHSPQLFGLNGIGIDADPVAAAIKKSKSVNPVLQNTLKDATNILNFENSGSQRTPDDEFWHPSFDHKKLIEFCNIRNNLSNNCKSNFRIALRGLILDTLYGPKAKYTQSYFYKRMLKTHTTKPYSAIRFWKKHNVTRAQINVLKVIEARSRRFYLNLFSKIKGNAYLHHLREDFTSLDDKAFKWITTSLSYLGMNDCGINQRLRERFICGPEYPDYRSKNRLASGSIQRFESALKSVWKKVSVLSVLYARRGGIVVYRRKAS